MHLDKSYIFFRDGQNLAGRGNCIIAEDFLKKY